VHKNNYIVIINNNHYIILPFELISIDDIGSYLSIKKIDLFI